MQNFKQVVLLMAAAFACAGTIFASGELHGPIRITSTTLGYDLQYWVYLPELPYSEVNDSVVTDSSVIEPKIARHSLPELYMTDGQGYLSGGEMVQILDSEIASGRISPVAAIFIDSRDPDDLTIDRRNDQFMCNSDYGTFVLGELMPEIASRWTGADTSTRRGLSGISFGAINAACFGLMMPDVFQLLIMLSPANGQHVDVVRKLYEEKPRQPFAVFITHGGRQDNAAAASRFIHTLEEKGYPLRSVTNNGRHDWNNWRALIDDSLRAFVGSEAGDRLE